MISHCVYVPQLLYPLICHWTSGLLPCPSCCRCKAHTRFRLWSLWPHTCSTTSIWECPFPWNLPDFPPRWHLDTLPFPSPAAPGVCFDIRTVMRGLCCVYRTCEHPPVNSRFTSFAHFSTLRVQLSLWRGSSRTGEIKPSTVASVSTYLLWVGHFCLRSCGSSPRTYAFQFLWRQLYRFVTYFVLIDFLPCLVNPPSSCCFKNILFSFLPMTMNQKPGVLSSTPNTILPTKFSAKCHFSLRIRASPPHHQLAHIQTQSSLFPRPGFILYLASYLHFLIMISPLTIPFHFSGTH